MSSWNDFTQSAAHIAGVFERRHAAAASLCMLATLRSDGCPRISPMEPRIFEDHLCLVGMPGTTKFKDLERDPRFSLHTATVDTHVKEGDAKLWGSVCDLDDEAMHDRFAAALYERTGFDIRGRRFDHFYVADIAGASTVEVGDCQLDITVWKEGEQEKLVHKR